MAERSERIERVTLQTIADHVGVSRMTVSNAFSRPDQLSAQLRDRVLEVADQLGYTGPDPTARALASGTSATVGVLLSDTLGYALTDEVAMAFLAAIAEELTPTGFALTLLPATEQHGMVPARDVAIDGAVVYSCDPDSASLSWLVRRRVPLVFVDQAPAAGIASVNVDDRGGAAAAAQHLVELGHRRIAIVTAGIRGKHGIVADPLATALANTERQRLSGWLHMLSAAGITPLVVREGHGDPYETGLAAAGTVLRHDDRPTGVLCFSDAIARGVIAGVAATGLRVPDDMSVVGFDDSTLAQLTQPALTTVHQDIRAKGSAAANALIAAIHRGKTGTSARGRHVHLPTELVVRDSTGAAPRSGVQRRARAGRGQSVRGKAERD